MQKKVLIGLAVAVALAIAGWLVWTQLIAPNGASQEPAMIGTPQTEEAAVALAGSWKSSQDERFVRTFREDGTLTDTYEGDRSATMSGAWSLVSEEDQALLGLPDVDGARVVSVQFPEEVLYFAIVEHTEHTLALQFLTGNGTLAFTRVD